MGAVLWVGCLLGLEQDSNLASLVAQMVKNLPAIQIQLLGWEDPTEKGMGTHSSILAWGIPWTEEPGGLQSMASKGVSHDWATFIDSNLARKRRLNTSSNLVKLVIRAVWVFRVLWTSPKRSKYQVYSDLINFPSADGKRVSLSSQGLI